MEKKIDDEGNVINEEKESVFDKTILDVEPEQEAMNGKTVMSPRDYDMVDKRTWKEFREAGLLFLVNQFLHIFGWSIVVEYSFETKRVRDVFPARVKYRGFSGDAIDRGYRRISTYMKNNAEQLEKEAYEKDE